MKNSFSKYFSTLQNYRYSYNGMEADHEISGHGNSYTTQFRQYDPRLGRWKSLDPLAGKHPDQSAFAAFNNNAQYFVDPSGLEGTEPSGGGDSNNSGGDFTMDFGSLNSKPQLSGSYSEPKPDSEPMDATSSVFSYSNGVSHWEPQVMPSSALPEQTRALAIINQFSADANIQGGAFTNISKVDFVNSLTAIITNPMSVTQGGHPICGIATSVSAAAKLDPVTLVEMAIDLYVYGQYGDGWFGGTLNDFEVPIHLALANNFHGLTPAEFILLTTIKHNLNPVLGYDNNPSSVLNATMGITLPAQIYGLLTTYFAINYPATLPEINHTVADLQTALGAGGVIILWTSWNEFKNAGSTFEVTSQHYVILTKIIAPTNSVMLYQVEIINPQTGLPESHFFSSEQQIYDAIMGAFLFTTP